VRPGVLTDRCRQRASALAAAALLELLEHLIEREAAGLLSRRELDVGWQVLATKHCVGKTRNARATRHVAYLLESRSFRSKGSSRRSKSSGTRIVTNGSCQAATPCGRCCMNRIFH